MIKAGAHIDNYKVMSLLGTGTYGSVYKAWHSGLDRAVAIKLMNRSVMDEADGLARFEREAMAMSALKHKNIVAFHGFGVWEMAPYMVMEFVEGTSVANLLVAKQPLPAARALDIAIQLCDALSAAHKVGIVHRDLKPSNMMLAEIDGRECLKIIDFGLAKLMPGYGVAAQKLTETGMAVGTCYYMSPEQCVGNAQVDHRSDIYAAGCILYEMLAASPPFFAEDSVAVMFQHVNAPPPRLTATITPDAQTHGLQAVIDKAMEKDVEARYQSADEMLSDLRAVAIGNTRAHALAKAAKTARPKGSSIYAKRDFKKLLPAALGLAFVCAAGIYALSMHQNRDATHDSVELASNLYDEISRESVRSGPNATAEEREHLFVLTEKALELNRQDHSLTRDQEYQMLHGQELPSFAINRPDQAITICKQAIRLAPTSADRVSDIENLARAYEVKNEDTEAKRILLDLSKDPSLGGADSKRVNMGLARLAMRSGNEAEARRYLSLVPELNLPGSISGTYYEMTALFAFIDGKYDDAMRLYEQGHAGAGYTDDPIFQLGIARCLLMQKRTEEYAHMRSTLDRLWKRFDGRMFRSVGLLDGIYAIETNDKCAVTTIGEELAAGKTNTGEFPVLNDWDREQFCQRMTKAGYNQLVGKIKKTYGWR